MAIDIVELMALSGLVKRLNGYRLWDEALVRWLLAGFDMNGGSHRIAGPVVGHFIAMRRRKVAR